MSITKREYQNPQWVSEDRDQIMCDIVAHYDDGTTKTARAVVSDPNGDNPDWAAIMDEYGVEALDKDMADAKAEMAKRREKDEAEMKRMEERRKQEKLFATKLEIFEIDEIRSSKDRAAKAQIRKAKSQTEAILRGSALLIKEQSNKSE
jgi:alpha-galactosidase/6-phospho-beta-glucosidase family protein